MVDVPFPIASPTVRSRLRSLIEAGTLPAIMPRRMFAGACLENHECVGCGTEIHTGEQEFAWTNPGNQVLYFHRRCVEIYRTLNGG